jgi:hypothetical protein
VHPVTHLGFETVERPANHEECLFVDHLLRGRLVILPLSYAAYGEKHGHFRIIVTFAVC